MLKYKNKTLTTLKNDSENVLCLHLYLLTDVFYFLYFLCLIKYVFEKNYFIFFFIFLRIINTLY